MLKRRLVALGISTALVLGLQSARMKGEPVSGLYQITSGRYITCCGIAGQFTTPLPKPQQAFIELKVDLERNLAQMKIVGQDMETVLSIWQVVKEFSYELTNGIVFPDRIEFENPPARPDEPSYRYVISNSVDGLRINGRLDVPCPGCADIPTEFEHTNVVAVLMPTVAVRVSEVEVCWNTASNRTYQVQYRSALTTNIWTDLGSQVAGNGSLQCITDRVPTGQAQRYYRVLTLP